MYLPFTIEEINGIVNNIVEIRILNLCFQE